MVYGGIIVSILIVDDSSFILQFVEYNLKAAGYTEIYTVKSGEQVLSFLNSNDNYNHVELILMDVFMSGMDGISVCKTLKQDPKFKHIPVMIMTADASEEILQKSFDAGAADYIAKPIRKTELLARVNSAIQLKREMDKVKQRERELLEVKHKLELANLELARLVSLDGLTGIPNRRSFDQTIVAEWQRAYTNGTWLGLIMIDIDYFKQFNDTYGHQAGDFCLQLVAFTIRQTLKGSCDFVARYGGEEFAVILPETDLAITTEIAEKIRMRIQELQIPHYHSKLPNGVITISLGTAAMFPQEVGPNAWGQLIQAADKALYIAKSRGRNSVCQAQ